LIAALRNEDESTRCSRLCSGCDGEPGGPPLGKSRDQPSRSTAIGAENLDRAVGVDAVRAPAVGHHVSAVRDVAQARLQLGDRDRDGTANVPGGELGLRAYVEHHHVAVHATGRGDRLVSCQNTSPNADATSIPATFLQVTVNV
jgi:hypothetical protein